MTKHIAMLSIHIDFTAKPDEDPSLVADIIARDVSDILRQRFDSMTMFLDDVLDQEEK